MFAKQKAFRAIKAIVLVLLMPAAPAVAAVDVQTWGTNPAGQAVKLYTLSDGSIRVQLTEYGARIVSIETPDRKGNIDDIVLGYSDFAQYLADPKDYFGAVVGRYGNRIAKGTFTLASHTYHIPHNNNGNALHGGPEGFSSKVWSGRVSGEDQVEFTLRSPDGDMGFPGALTVRVLYTLTGHQLRIDYEAATTKPTVINLTNHSYFNLAGQASGDILRQRLRINADRFTPIDSTLIPTGLLQPVNDSAFDFRQLMPIGQHIGNMDQQLKFAGGFDHNFVLNGTSGKLREAAYAVDPANGRTLTILTTEPGVQFYSGNFLDGSAKGFTGTKYDKHAGFCLETQHFPDSPNRPDFPSTILVPGKEMHSTTVFVFGVVGE